MTATTVDTALPVEIVRMLRRSFGACAAKVIARYADVSHRTAEDWLQGRSMPRLDKAMRLMRHPVFYAEMADWMALAVKEENEIRDRLQKLRTPVAPLAKQHVARAGAVGDGSRGELPGQGAGAHRAVRRAA